MYALYMCLYQLADVHRTSGSCLANNYEHVASTEIRNYVGKI